MKRKFIISILVLVISITGYNQNINECEYFFDIDPGIGNGISFPVSYTAIVDDVYEISIADLELGWHKLYFRYRNQDGLWSLYEGRSFLISTPPIDPKPIVEMEYFIGSDPGIGNAIQYSVEETMELDVDTGVEVGGLEEGNHIISYRVKDGNEQWSLVMSADFQVDFDADISNNYGKCTEINVYPNPTSDFLTFEVEECSGRNCDYQVIICDVLGQVMCRVDWLIGQSKITVENLPCGYYSYSIFENSGNLLTQGKIVVMD